MAGVAGKLTTVSLPDRPIFVDGGAHAAGHYKAVTLDSTTVDSGSTPTTRLRPGLVVGKGTGSKWYDAGDSAVTAGTRASVTGTGATYAGAETITLSFKGGPTISVTTATASTTATGVVNNLNADAEFSAVLYAEVSGSNVKISSVEPGADQFFEVLTAPAGWGLATGVNKGTSGEFGVLTNYVDMLGPDGAVANMIGVQVAQRGRFDETYLIGITSDAREYLLNRGSHFE